MFDWNDSTVAQLRRLRESGMTGGEIVEQMPGTTRSGVLGKLWRLSIPAPPPKPRKVKPKPARLSPAPKPPKPTQPRLSPAERRVVHASVTVRFRAKAARVQGMSDAPLPAAGLVRFLDQADGCAFPMWSHSIDWQVPGALETAMVCGRPRRPGGSRYCYPHHRLAYIPVAERVEGDRA